MFRRVLTWSAGSASAAIALAAIAGLLAPLDPRLEMANHFRPFLFAGALAALAIAVAFRRLPLITGTLVVGAFLALLMLVPLRYAAPKAQAKEPALRVASFNLSLLNGRLNDAAAFLASTNADVIVLQEVLCAQTDPLFAELRAQYEHVYRDNPRCFGQAILSRHPIIATGRFDSGWRRPLWIWADIRYRGKIVRVTGVHLSHPTRPADQAHNIEQLITHLRSIGLPHVIAGDFNLTPYSWLLTKLSRRSGARRHATYLRSWPSDLPLPIVLIDHVFTSAHFDSGGFTVGPNVGSDHYPVIADLVLQN